MTPGGGRPGADALVRATITAVVADDPLTGWLIPHPAARSAFAEAYSALFCDHAAEHADMHVTDDGLGVIVWYTFGDATVARERNVYGDTDLITAACRAAQAQATLDPSAKLDDVYVRLDDLDAALTYRQPVGAHHQVALLGVHPSARRHGVATRLLQHHAAHLDAAGAAAYVVATSAEGRDLFTRHGYRVSWPAVPLPGGPPLWPMWRDSHPERRAHQLDRAPGTASSDRGNSR